MNPCDKCYLRNCYKIPQEVLGLMTKKICNFEIDHPERPQIIVLPKLKIFDGVAMILGLQVTISPKIKHLEDMEVY